MQISGYFKIKYAVTPQELVIAAFLYNIVSYIIIWPSSDGWHFPVFDTLYTGKKKKKKKVHKSL